jgi:large conductance mechanosensitive channel
MRGNVVDLAVGVIIGGAFGKIVSSLVGDMFMPVLGLLTGGINFSDMALTLKEGDGPGHPAVLLAYGKFLQATFDFIIVAFAIFLFIKALNRFKAQQPTPPPAGPTPSEALLAEIRDLLKKQTA